MDPGALAHAGARHHRATRIAGRIEQTIHGVLVRPRDCAKIAADVRDMRQRIAAEKGTDEIWNLKHVRGGLVDLEFMAQYLQLIHAAEHPDVLDQNTVLALQKLDGKGLIPGGAGAILISAARLLNDLTQIVDSVSMAHSALTKRLRA